MNPQTTLLRMPRLVRRVAVYYNIIGFSYDFQDDLDPFIRPCSIMNYLVLSVVLTAFIGGAFGQFTFQCDEDWREHGVDQCPRKGRTWPLEDDPDEYMKCCSHEGELIPSTGLRVRVYGCCAGMPEYVYGIMAGAAGVIIISIILCCCCCCSCCKRRQQPGFILFHNPPVVVQQGAHAAVDPTGQGPPGTRPV